MRPTLLLVLCILSNCGVFGQAVPDSTVCDTVLPVSSPISAISVVGNKAIVKTGLAFSSSRMSVRNEADSAIVEYAFLLELFDANHRRLESLVFHAAPKVPSAPYTLLPISELRSSIQPHAIIDISGESPIVNSHCPASAVMTFAFVKFENGKTLRHAALNWHADPGVEVRTDHLVLGACQISGGSGATAAVRITAKGDLHTFALFGQVASATLTSCLRRELAFWKFVPAVINGQPRAATLKVLVLFDLNPERASHWQDEYSRELAAGVIVLALNRSNLVENMWNVSVGADCCIAGTKFHP